MYFPYLYGKQKELLAVRSIAKEFAGTNLLSPVIEPAKSQRATLKKTLEACEKHKLPLYMGVNPCQLDFQQFSRSQAYEWGKNLLKELKSRKYIRPTLIIEEWTQRADIKQFVKDYSSDAIGVILRLSSFTPAEIADELSGVQADVKIFIHGGAPSVGTLNALGKKRCVWVEERFPHRSRNADYAGRHPFTDRHLTWKKSGYGGFSDFTVLSPKVSKGGGQPGAVAFHLTYIELEDPAEEVYVEHFVSDRQDQKEKDNDGKMLEALHKFTKALKRTSTSFGITQTAAHYKKLANSGSPPSLAVNKQLQITHHMELMHGLLDGSYP